MDQTLKDLAERTDSLTYLNALKVTVTQIKQEAATQEELRLYMNESSIRLRKLVKKVDNQYRLFARLVTKEPLYTTDVTVDETLPEELEELKEVMESE